MKQLVILTFIVALAFPSFTRAQENELTGKIAFSALTEGVDGIYIYVMSPDGSQIERLTDNGYQHYEYYPSWSPDGESIAYQLQRARSADTFWVANSDGSNPRDISKNFRLSGFWNFPRWSPTGDTLIFGSRDSDYTPNGIFSSSIEELEVAPHMLLATRKPLNYLSISPDNKNIIFTLDEGGNEVYAYIVAMGDDSFERILDDFSSLISMDWSPDSIKVMFKSFKTSTSESIIYQYDVSEDTYEVFWSRDYDFAYSPDGQYVALLDWDRLTIVKLDGKIIVKTFDLNKLIPNFERSHSLSGNLDWGP